MKMQRDYWNDFYQSGRVSDYLKYVDSSKNTASAGAELTETNNSSCLMESKGNAGKSDRNGAFGHAGWRI
jgi:hypothetical protein